MSDEKNKKDDPSQAKVKKNIFGKEKRQLSIHEEEQVQTPLRTIFKNFLSRRITRAAIVIYMFIFLCCLILPFFFPVDYAASDSTQMNIKPGFTFMAVPEALKNNAAMIDTGANYSVGIDKAGEVYVWGNLSEKLKVVPNNMGNVISVSAGFDHIVALNDEGDIFTWGSSKFGLESVPTGIKNAHIVQIEAGYQISFALDDEGKLYVWGNENLISVNPKPVQGQIKEIATNISTALAILNDGTVKSMSKKETAYNEIPDEIQGKVVGLASTDKAAAALLNDGTVVVWGQPDYDIKDIPDKIQGKVVKITGGSGHFSVLLNDGSVESWGLNFNGQSNAPGGSDYVFMDSDYKANYAIDADGNVTGWGLKGYLMGTDQMGRDIFPRLLAGGRISLMVGISSVVIAAIIGILVGGVSGYLGGTVDIILMRIAEVFNSIPFLPIAIILSYIVGNKIGQFERVFMIMAIQGCLSWPSIARLVRGQILSERENEYVTAAKAMGIKEATIIFKHIFPNIIGSFLVSLTLRLASSIMFESTLSFIGFGITEPVPTWGNMLNGSMDARVIAVFWWRWLFTAIALSATTLSIYMIGDGLRDAIDPKTNER